MRNNQPITNDEFVIPEGMTLVSKTDLNGTILECNDAFELSSGYSRKELIGQPHNMVRHPDVPEAVFADMWQALKMGAPWSQIVKNRRANGGFYWVRANATPIFKGGEISGYMSVRSKATPEEIAAATQAYQDINNGKASIKFGRISSGFNFSGMLDGLKRLTPQYLATLIASVFYILPIIIYTLLDGHNPIYIIPAALLAVIPAFLYGLKQHKGDSKKRITLQKIASGEGIGDEWFDPRTADGKLLSAIKSTALAAQERYEESQYQLDAANRLQMAMDQVNSNVMIADANLNIIYMNKTMHKFFDDREKQLQTALPKLKSSDIMGSNIDVFHQNPAHNRAMLDSIKQPTLASIQVAGFYLDLNVIPVYNRAGIQTSTIVEWQDRTSEHQLLDEVGQAVNAAKAGILNRRIDLEKTQGVTRELSESINDLLANVEKPINEAVKVAVALSEGDLTQHSEGEYLGRFAVMQDSLNVAVSNLSSMMAQTKSASENVSGGAAQIYQGSVDLNNRTQEQAASLEQTASSMEQMTAAVKQNAHNAQQASEVTHTSANLAQSGVKVMDDAISSMEQINESSQKINDIISLIDSIAFQTNLLALNAAVEAARAGEHGRGFAVVAGEVRTLAQKSADAAKDIRLLIEDTVKKVTEGTGHVKGSGDALNGIVESINNVNLIIEEIASSSKEQSEGVTSVNQSITTIDSAVQQNAALVEETAATAEELGAMSKQMTNNVGQFKISDHALRISGHSEPGMFDFASARRAHRQWRVKVRAYINDVDVNFDRNTATDGSACALGQWIYGEGQSLQSMPSFQKLERTHAELHSFIGRILDLKDIGDFESANEQISALAEHSDDVIDLISTLEKELIGGEAAIPTPKPIEKFDSKAAVTKPTKKQASKPTAAKPASTKRAAPAASKPTASQQSTLQTPAPTQSNSSDEWSEF